ncbi:Eukaryotic translation initiation factor 3 subunit E [Terramyces sp. JEL0728]|nr:Eukaryotic translation initiation factor 3 subunit E [Terramyces sp. JEL0728]
MNYNEISQFLDKHLLLAIMEADDCKDSRLMILSKTKMVKEEILLAGETKELKEKKTAILKQVEQEKEKFKECMNIINKNQQLDQKHLKSLLDYALFNYEIGDYKQCDSLLTVYLKYNRNQKALWGRLNCLILLEKLDTAFEIFLELKDFDGDLIYKSWIVHYSLFFLNHEKKEVIYDLLFTQSYQSTISARHHLQEFLKLISTETNPVLDQFKQIQEFNFQFDLQDYFIQNQDYSDFIAYQSEKIYQSPMNLNKFEQIKEKSRQYLAKSAVIEKTIQGILDKKRDELMMDQD